jgi:transcriptional regulator with XRE-family HTH domain
MATRKRKPEALAPESVGERMRRLRQAKGLTQAEIADKVGISRRGYIYYEAEGGSPSPELLARIAQVLGVSTDVLATGSGAPRAKAQPPIENLRLLRRLKRLQELPPHDQKAVLRMIDMMADARSRAS